MRLRTRTTAAIALLLPLIAGCSDATGSVTAPDLDAAKTTPISADPAVWASAVTGQTGPGSTYALYLPVNWNGDVVYYAHGIIDASAPVTLPTADGVIPFRDALGALGYAVAYSSWSENGYALKDAVQRTHQLRGLFTSQFGKADQSYLVGHSLGALATVSLAERHPQQYDGVLAMCGPLGGTEAQLDYVANVRVLFDFFYPGVLPGDALNVPQNFDVNTQLIPAVVAAVQANPTGALLMARMAQTPLAVFGATQTQQVTTLIQSLITALGYNIRGTNDVLGRTHGHSPFDNSQTVYTAAAPGLVPPSVLAAINAGVDRFTSTPDAVNWADHYYQPSGDEEIPVLTLHNRYDPTVPYFHEPLFAAAVAAAGASDMLVQRTFNQYGHCTFTTQQMVQAFTELTNWVENGVKPQP